MFKKLIPLVLVLALLVPTLVSADGIFQPCNYLNNCETFATHFEVTKHNKGILVEGTVPDADLANSGNPLEVIVTTGNVYTQCRNHGAVSVDGDVLWRGNVQAGHFSAYIPLPEGDYNITAYLGQVDCGNCPQAWVVPITVKHKQCTEWQYVKVGRHSKCYLIPNDTDKRSELPARFDNTSYVQGLCRWGCDLNEFNYTGKWYTTCKLPPACTACP